MTRLSERISQQQEQSAVNAQLFLKSLVVEQSQPMPLEEAIQTYSLINFYDLIYRNLSKQYPDLVYDSQNQAKLDTFVGVMFTQIADVAQDIREREALIGAKPLGDGEPSTNALPHLDDSAVQSFMEFAKREQILNKIGRNFSDENNIFIDTAFLYTESAVTEALLAAIKKIAPSLLEEQNKSELKSFVHRFVFEMANDLESLKKSNPQKLSAERSKANLLPYFPSQTESLENNLISAIEVKNHPAEKQKPQQRSFLAKITHFFKGTKQ